MATYSVQAPDGHTIQLQGPDGASHDQVIAMAQQLYKPGSAPTPPPNPTGAIPGEQDLGSLGNGLMAAGLNFVHQIPLVGDAGLTAGRFIGDAARGNPQSWQGANNEVQQQLQAANQTHPIASTAGGFAGGGASALVGGAALRGASGGEAVFQALPKATSIAGHLANAGRLAVMGGAAGAAQGAAQGGGEQAAALNFGAAPQAALSGAQSGGIAGATGGAILGSAAGIAGNVKAAFAPLASKTASALSKVFDESPADLQAAWDGLINAGHTPALAELAGLKSQGLITGAAKNSDHIAAALANVDNSQAVARAAALRGQIAAAPVPEAAIPAPQASGALTNVKDTQGDLDYGAARAQPNFTIPTESSEDFEGLSPAEHLAGSPLDMAGFKTPDKVAIRNQLSAGTLSPDYAQQFTARLGAAASGPSPSPMAQTYHGDLQSILAGPGNEAPATALDAARANFAANARSAEGAAHGESILNSTTTAPNYAAEATSKNNANPEFAATLPGGAKSALINAAGSPVTADNLARRMATDESLNAKMTTALGDDGAAALRRSATALSDASTSLGAVSSRMPGSQANDASSDLSAFAHAAATVMSHSAFYKILHATRVLSAVGLRMSPQVEDKVAQYLSDPAMSQTAINILRDKAGATPQQLNQIAVIAGSAMAGGYNGAAEQTK